MEVCDLLRLKKAVIRDQVLKVVCNSSSFYKAQLSPALAELVPFYGSRLFREQLLSPVGRSVPQDHFDLT
jgi:hypothetical protein